MASRSISDPTSFQNQQQQIHENLTTHLARLEALMAVVLSLHFFELNNRKMHDYFSVVAALIDDAVELNRNLVIF